MEVKRFAVLLCAQDSEYMKSQYGGYYGVFKGMLGEEGEVWDVYRVPAGELPGDGEIELYDGFVITGSCNDAHGDDAWICELVSLLRKLDSMKKKVLGICFGHQVTIAIDREKSIAFSIPRRIVIASPFPRAVLFIVFSGWFCVKNGRSEFSIRKNESTEALKTV